VLVSTTIVNIKLYHILIDGGAALNLISLAIFRKLQISMTKLQPSRPFSRVGSVLVIPRDCISLLVIFGTPENFCTESVLFNVVEVSLPFNAVLGMPALYQFIAAIHHAGVSALENSRLWLHNVRLQLGQEVRIRHL
jgi:hypothetical protein